MWDGLGSHRSTPSRQISPLWLSKCGLTGPKIAKIGNFSYKFAPNRYIMGLSGTVSLFESLCNRSLNFVRKCLNCDNILVNFVSRHALFYSRMCSVMRRNVQYFCERFGACCLDVIDSSKQWRLMADEVIVFRAGMIQELVMVRDGLLCM